MVKKMWPMGIVKLLGQLASKEKFYRRKKIHKENMSVFRPFSTGPNSPSCIAGELKKDSTHPLLIPSSSRLRLR